MECCRKLKVKVNGQIKFAIGLNHSILSFRHKTVTFAIQKARFPVCQDGRRSPTALIHIFPVLCQFAIHLAWGENAGSQTFVHVKLGGKLANIVLLMNKQLCQAFFQHFYGSWCSWALPVRWVLKQKSLSFFSKCLSFFPKPLSFFPKHRSLDIWSLKNLLCFMGTLFKMHQI